MNMKYPGKCYACSVSLGAGQRVHFEVEEKVGGKKHWRFFCTKECFDKGSLGEKPAADSVSEPGNDDTAPSVSMADLAANLHNGTYSSNADGLPENTKAKDEPKEREFTLDWFRKWATWRTI